jgi:hypothetical protein
MLGSDRAWAVRLPPRVRRGPREGAPPVLGWRGRHRRGSGLTRYYPSVFPSRCPGSPMASTGRADVGGSCGSVVDPPSVGMGANLDWVKRSIVHNPFRRSWSVRMGRVRIFSVPWYWDVLRERLAESSARQRPVAPPPAHHDHYCEECDRRWVQEDHTCATPWASPCAGERHQGAGTGRGGWADGRGVYTGTLTHEVGPDAHPHDRGSVCAAFHGNARGGCG